MAFNKKEKNRQKSFIRLLTLVVQVVYALLMKFHSMKHRREVID